MQSIIDFLTFFLLIIIDIFKTHQTFLESASDEDKMLFRALIDENFEHAFNAVLSSSAGRSIDEQVASFIAVLENYTFEEQDTEELLNALQKQGLSSAAAGGTAAGGAAAASPNSKSHASGPAASSSSFVPASPARGQQNENPIAGRTYFKV